MKFLKSIFLYLRSLLIFIINGNIYSKASIIRMIEFIILKIFLSDLRKDADVVIRDDFIHFEVKDESRAVETVKIAVTIFKKNEQNYGRLYLWYDKFREVDDLEGIIYDADGNEIRDLEDSDIEDFPAYNNFSLYEDNRIKKVELYNDKFPYTVEFKYKISYDGFINWPTWYSRESINPVEHCIFEVSVPENNILRYWCNVDSISPAVINDGDEKLYTWKADNLALLPKDAVDNAIEDYSTVVKIAPGKFEIEGNEGNMSSWKSLGTWYYNLTKGKDVLPDSIVSKIKNMMSNENDIHDKIRTLYKYMQSKTRYVSIQLGIGGWQPFDASYVNDRGYGDCKALSNYMISILKEAGIKAYPVLIRSGSYNYTFIKEFPSSQFNHVIVTVPLKSDTIWLECTSQTMPFGHLSWSTENRNALMVTNEGGVVVQTPSSAPEENLQKRVANVEINSLGWAMADIKSTWTGDQQDRVRSSISESSPEEIKKWILNLFSVPNLRLEKYNYDGIDEHSLEISLNMHTAIANYANISGKRIFINPNLMDKETYIPPEIDKRLSPLRFGYPFLDIDSIYYNVPDGYSIESMPEETNIKTSFGNFSSKSEQISPIKILYVRKLQRDDYTIPADKYEEYRNFYTSIVKADRSQVVLVKK